MMRKIMRKMKSDGDEGGVESASIHPPTVYYCKLYRHCRWYFYLFLEERECKKAGGTQAAQGSTKLFF